MNILITLLISLTFANDHCDGTKESPCIVQDTRKNTPKVRNYRDTPMIIKSNKTNKINLMGLSDLYISGSAAPSVAGFMAIINRIKKVSHNDMEIVDLDLRQESHGYINHNAFELEAKNNWGNMGLDKNTVMEKELNWINQISSQEEIKNVLNPIQFKLNLLSLGKDIEIKSSQTEQEVVSNLGVRYFRLTISDHSAPKDEDIEEFMNFYQTLNQNTWIHVHCRGGVGRTTTFMALLDMLKNADKVSFLDILARQSNVAPKTDLLTLLPDTSAKNKASNLRPKFLHKFYLYAKERLSKKENIDWKTFSP